ncbi:MAG: hypothetical protein AAGG68_07870 [Bacteroidota bacterium]
MSHQLSIIHHLSEDSIKQATLSFLKSYYRYRPSLMENDLQKGIHMDARYDETIGTDITIDGYIAYQQRSGSTFTATFEASSYDKRYEVLYQIQPTLVMWDGLTIATSIATLSFLYSYAFWDYNLKEIWGVLALCYILGIGVLTLLYRWACINWPDAIDRYHYIYAVEQFKRYHADEQWIAVGEDIFTGPTDPKLLELRDQCIKNGFGLIEVREDLVPFILITPSRDTILKNRKRFDLNITAESIKQLIKKTPYANYLRKNLGRARRRLQKVIRQDADASLRFQRNYYTQMGITSAGILLVAALFWKDVRVKEVIVEDYDEYLREIDERKYDVWKAPETKVQDTLDQLFIQPFTEVEFDYLHTPEDQPNYILRKKEEQERSSDIVDDFVPVLPSEQIIDSSGKMIVVERPGFYFTSQGELIDSFPCNYILEDGGVQYIVQQSIFANKKLAFRQVDTLATKGISSNLFHTICENSYPDSFIVFLDTPFDSSSIATTQALLSMQKLQLAGFDIREVQVRELRIRRKE